MAKTGINLAEMFKENQSEQGTEDGKEIQTQDKTPTNEGENTDQLSELQNNNDRDKYKVSPSPVKRERVSNIERGQNVSTILAGLSENSTQLTSEELVEVIEGVFSRMIETNEEKMISFRGSKMLDDFFLQLQASLKAYSNKKISKEKLMDLILQVVIREPNYREKIIGGVLIHMVNGK